MKLSNVCVILTGATGGIGQALAKELDIHGATLLLVGRDEFRLQELKSSLSHRHCCVTADLNTGHGREALTVAVGQLPSTPSILINNAGISEFSLFNSISEQRIRELIECNLLAPMLITQSLIPMMSTSGAQIINVGSTFGAIGFPGFAAYSATKFGLRGFSEALGRELADRSIIVQHVAPRATRTRINSNAVNQLNSELGNRTDSPESVARQIVKLISTRQKSVFIGWPEKFIVVLNQLFAGLISRSIRKQLPTIKHHAQE